MPGGPDSPMYDTLELVGTMGDFLTELHKYYKDKCGMPIFGGLEEDGDFLHSTSEMTDKPDANRPWVTILSL